MVSKRYRVIQMVTVPSRTECCHAVHTSQQGVFYVSQMRWDLRGQPAYVTISMRLKNRTRHINSQIYLYYEAWDGIAVILHNARQVIMAF